MKNLLLGLSLSLFASAAFAADAIVDEVVVVDEGFNWSGVYVGIQGGYGWGETTVTSPGDEIDIDVDGAFGGGHVGVRWQLDSFTVGAEAEINYADIGGSTTLTAGVGSATFTSDINWFGSLNAEIGLPMDRTLLYVTAGVAFADIDYGGTSTFIPTVVSDSDTSVGWTAGFGADYAVTDNIVLGARYRYYDFGDADFSAFQDGQFFISDRSYDTDLHTVSLKAAYKF